MIAIELVLVVAGAALTGGMVRDARLPAMGEQALPSWGSAIRRRGAAGRLPVMGKRRPVCGWAGVAVAGRAGAGAPRQTIAAAIGGGRL